MTRPSSYAIQILVSSHDNIEVYEKMVEDVVEYVRSMLLDVYNIDIADPATLEALGQGPVVLSQDLRNYDARTGKFLPPEEEEWRYE